jgi:hypothetical protein
VDVGAETVAYAAYRNALARAREELSPEQFALFEEDLAKARAAVEVAWLERGVAGGQSNQRVMPEERHGANSARPTFGPVETIGLTTSDGVW